MEKMPSRLRFVQSNPLRGAQKRYHLMFYPRFLDQSPWNPDSQRCAPGVSGFKFSDDGQLSWDIKEAEFWRAWSARYYVPNIGHDRDPDYYEQNYASMQWIGLEEWWRRVAEARHRPQVHHRSVGKEPRYQLATNPLNYAYSYWPPG